MLGGGWMVRPADPEEAGPSALVALISVPRDQIGEEHIARFELQEASGAVVEIEGEEIVVETTFEVQGRRDASIQTPLIAKFAISLGPFPLAPGRDYAWRLLIDGKTQDAWVARFRTSPPYEHD